MVMFASLLGVAAIYARVASASPMPDYGYGAAASSSGGYQSASSSAAPSYQTGSSYGNNYGSGSYDSSSQYDSSSSAWVSSSSSSAYAPAYTQSSSGSYGSGSTNWNSGGYDSCVQQCVAQYGAPSSMSAPPTATSSSGSSGTGATHTVWVAPTQGVLRYLPFAVNASVGDTVQFIWGADTHTVTKSSELSPCNKTSDAPFASGIQTKGFSFTQVVNDTNTTFFYCGVATHCEQGMFGMINPPNAFQQPSSASNMIPSLAGSNPSTQAGWSYAQNATSNNTAAAAWGDNIDMSKLPDWAQSYAAENILISRSFLAMNPETINAAGTVNLAPLANNAIMMPTDVAAAARQNNAASAPSSSSAPAGSSTPSAASSSAAPSGSSGAIGAASNGAGALASPRVAVALIAVVSAFFAL
ncbi:hypothetical protein BC834DRAFT_947599 [Gloeopeniophorella convolvens]|nr:hypothetical protein BC834DRAFT_947599 [Gloeopeniophorella convolvens]